MKAGFIGYRHFAAKLHKLFDEQNVVSEFIFYHPDKRPAGLNCTNDLDRLLDCDFIVIASPDQTHRAYLEKLKDYPGYIFCEKIPVLDREGLAFLKARRNPRLYFNFNYRKSELCRILMQTKGHVQHLSYCSGMGLAFKSGYESNWRSDASMAPLGVFQVHGIHFFDLLLFCYGRPLSYWSSAGNISHRGDSIDHFAIALRFEDGATADCFFSYVSPYIHKLDLITSEELIRWENDAVICRGPRETFDKDGLFITPPVTSQKETNIYLESLADSVRYFLSVVKAHTTFAESLAENNFLSTEIFLDILENTTGVNNVETQH